MSALPVTADDLQSLAEALRRISLMHAQTEVELGGYSGDPQVTFRGHALRVIWRAGSEEQPGQYVLEIPEIDY